MRTKLLILSAIFTTCLISCEKKMVWLNPDDPEADLSKISAMCEEKYAECGYIEQEFDGKMRKIFCGECTQEGYECKTYNRCGDIDECADTTLNNCHGNFECHNLDIKFDGKPFECVCKKNYSGDDCTPETRTKECEDLPENAEWNSVSEITQTWNGEDWEPSNQGTFNEETSETECRFKCKEDYFWNDSKCLSDTRTFKCTGLPENAVYNTVDEITQTWNGEEWIPSDESYFSETPSTTECRFKCASAEYTWNGSTCASNGSSTLPECSSTSSTPCRDSSSGLIWSARASSRYTWQDAVNYCSSYSEGGLSGWHLPTIDELRTLLIADRVKNNCQVSETNGCLSRSSCWSCSTCTQTGTQLSSEIGCDSWGTPYIDGRYSKFGETGYFWSSSTLSDNTDYAWYVYFYYGNVNYYSKSSNYDVRCVR